MGTLSVEKFNEFCADLGLVQEAIRAGVVSSRAKAADRHLDRWVDFCGSLHVDPWLHEIVDPVPLLQVFGARYRDGRIAPSGRPVKAGTVEDAMRAVGQAFARLGTQIYERTPPEA